MRIGLALFFLIFCFLQRESASAGISREQDRNDEILCGGVEPFDTRPDRPLKFGYETNLLLLITKPYIAGMHGILSKWQFVNGNRTFVAEVSSSALWGNGERVTAREAAIGIIAGLRNRKISKSIRLKDDTGLPPAEILIKKLPDSVRISEKYKFQIDFDGTVEDIPGVIVDALNQNSRINRVWPVRLIRGKRGSDIVGKLKLNFDGRNINLYPSVRNRIKIVFSKDDCAKADYYLSSSMTDANEALFDVNYSPDEQALLGIFNPRLVSTASSHLRRAIAEIARKRLQATNADQYRPTISLIQPNEAGYRGYAENKTTEKGDAAVSLGGIIRIRPWTKVPQGWKIKKALELRKIKEPYFEFAQETHISELLLTVAPVRKGRLLSLEHGTVFNEISRYKEIYPETYEALERIRTSSGSSVPRNLEIFSNLDRAIYREASIIPFGRFKISLLSKTSAKFKLVWDSSGEIEFITRS